jgi:SAM-dependent methyltransferase
MTGYDALALEYYDEYHTTCRNFDVATRAALANHPVRMPETGLVLEVGCGRGRCTEFLGVPPGRVVQLDVSREMLALGDREPSLLRVHADATSIPLFDGQFAAVVGFLIDPFVGLCFFAEASRLLVEGGLLLATSPAAEWGHALRGHREPEASLARFITKRRDTVLVPSALITKPKLAEMLSYCGFQAISVTDHFLPSDADVISPDIQTVADRRAIDVHNLPILYLVHAAKSVP